MDDLISKYYECVRIKLRENWNKTVDDTTRCNICHYDNENRVVQCQIAINTDSFDVYDLLYCHIHYLNLAV